MPKCDFNKVAANLQESTDAEKCDFNKVAKLLCNFIGITLRHGCSPVNLLHILRTCFPKNTSGGLLLNLLGAEYCCLYSINFDNPFLFLN